jgi:activator of HSP90 ATPase
MIIHMQCFLHFYEYEKKKRLEAKRRTFLFTDKKWRSSGKAIKDGSWKNGKTARTSTDGTGWRRIAKNGREFFSSLSSFVVVATIGDDDSGEKQSSFLDDDDDANGVRFVKPLRITGEAYLNQRKGKIIPGYELELSIDYELEGERVGTMVLPYVSDENRGEDTEVKFSPKDESEKAKKAKRWIEEKSGKEKVREVVKKWEEEMARGTPALAAKTSGESGSDSANNDRATEEAAAKQKPKQTTAKGKTEHEYKSAPLSTKYHTIKIKEKFLCRATDVCEALLDPRRVMHFTRTKCTGQKGVGKFEMFDGSVRGETITFIDGERIVQKWRFNSWVPDHYSTVTMVLKEPEPGNCILELTQTDVPEADAHGNENVMEVTENGWKNLIFARIRNAFGYGANL